MKTDSFFGKINLDMRLIMSLKWHTSSAHLCYTLPSSMRRRKSFFVASTDLPFRLRMASSYHIICGCFLMWVCQSNWNERELGENFISSSNFQVKKSHRHTHMHTQLVGARVEMSTMGFCTTHTCRYIFYYCVVCYVEFGWLARG